MHAASFPSPSLARDTRIFPSIIQPNTVIKGDAFAIVAKAAMANPAAAAVVRAGAGDDKDEAEKDEAEKGEPRPESKGESKADNKVERKAASKHLHGVSGRRVDTATQRWYKTPTGQATSPAADGSAPSWVSLEEVRRLTGLGKFSTEEVFEKLAVAADEEGVLDRQSFGTCFRQIIRTVGQEEV